MALNSPQRAAAPRRTGFALFSILSLLILGVFLASNLGGSSEARHASDFERAAREKASSSSNARAQAKGDKYLIGAGKGDITGPAGMQYAICLHIEFTLVSYSFLYIVLYHLMVPCM